MSPGWVERLDRVTRANRSLVCVGLDPDPRRMPIRDVAAFNRAIVDATADLACAFKPNLGYYEALGIEGMRALHATVRHIRDVAPDVVVIGDAKRGDVGPTAAAYARAMFDVWGFDAVTVNAYLGRDSVEPFLAHEGRGVIVVCRTSNPGAPELQDARVFDDDAGTTTYMYMKVARAAAAWNTGGQIGLVVGATYPRELASIRQAFPSLPLLVPGVGAQGGDAAQAARAGADRSGGRVMVNSARGIIYASGDRRGFANAAREAAKTLRDAINEALEGRDGKPPAGATPGETT